MSKVIWCNMCLAEGDWIDMQLRDGFLKCPRCGNESWPDMDGSKVLALKRQRQAEAESNKYVSLSLPEGVRVHGGSDPSGAIPEKGKKKSTQVLYKQLFKET